MRCRRHRVASSYLAPSTLARLGSLELKARTIVEGFLSGLHRSPYKGFSVEFAEYRQYLPGDDLSTLDWKVYARTDRHYVKKFEAETNITGYLAARPGNVTVRKRRGRGSVSGSEVTLTA
mgnify:CR=1 FL=1